MPVRTLSSIRDEYISRVRPEVRADAQHYAQGTPEQRIRRAAHATTRSGKKHKHQWRVPPAKLTLFAERLLGKTAPISVATTFEDLIAVVDAAKCEGIGELTVYDTAVRIGAGQQLEPEQVYLHAGTRKGAARLGLNVRRLKIPRAEFPDAFQGLSAGEIEDLLCRYADCFGSDPKFSTPRTCDGKKRGC